jgi:hypothetical protein
MQRTIKDLLAQIAMLKEANQRYQIAAGLRSNVADTNDSPIRSTTSPAATRGQRADRQDRASDARSLSSKSTAPADPVYPANMDEASAFVNHPPQLGLSHDTRTSPEDHEAETVVDRIYTSIRDEANVNSTAGLGNGIMDLRPDAGRFIGRGAGALYMCELESNVSALV